MHHNLRRTVILVAVALLAGVLASTAAASPRVRGCGSFAHQADAQVYFESLGGSIAEPIPKLDPDRDGVACESLPAPYRGYATLGYNRKRDFFYGTVTMPRTGSGSEPYPCMTGNSHFPEGPRLLNVYRVGGKRDHPLLGEFGVGAEARPSSGRLLWRADRKQVQRGRYYVSFEAKVPSSPSAETECPGFSSEPVELP